MTFNVGVKCFGAVLILEMGNVSADLSMSTKFFTYIIDVIACRKKFLDRFERKERHKFVCKGKNALNGPDEERIVEMVNVSRRVFAF